MNRMQQFSPSQESQFDVILSEEDYERLNNVSKLYKESLEANRILTEKFEQFTINTKDKDIQVQSLIKKVFTMTKRLICLEEENTQLQERCSNITIKMNDTIKLNNQLEQQIMKANNLLSSRESTLKKSQNQVQRLSNELSIYRQKSEKQQEVIKEHKNSLKECLQKIQNRQVQIKEQQNKIHQLQNIIKNHKNTLETYQNIIKEHQNAIKKHQNTIQQQQNKINKLSQRLEDYKLEKQDLQQKHRQSFEQITHTNQFLRRLTDQITKINALIQTKQQDKETNEQHHSIIQPKQYIHFKNTVLKQEKYCSIIMSEDSSLQFIQDSLTCIFNALQSHSQLIKKINALQESNYNLETSNEGLSKRIQAIQNHCSNVEQQMSSQLNICKVFENKYNGIRLTMSNKQQVNNAMEDLIKKYHEAIDDQYAKIISKLINE